MCIHRNKAAPWNRSLCQTRVHHVPDACDVRYWHYDVHCGWILLGDCSTCQSLLGAWLVQVNGSLQTSDTLLLSITPTFKRNIWFLFSHILSFFCVCIILPIVGTNGHVWWYTNLSESTWLTDQYWKPQIWILSIYAYQLQWISLTILQMLIAVDGTGCLNVMLFGVIPHVRCHIRLHPFLLLLLSVSSVVLVGWRLATRPTMKIGSLKYAYRIESLSFHCLYDRTIELTSW